MASVNMTPIECKQKLLNKNTNFDVNLKTVKKEMGQ